MKKLLLSMMISGIAICQVNAQILTNAGFENWSTVGLYLEPDGWLTLNGLTSPNATVIQGPGYTGNYSVALISDSVSAGQYTGGQISLQYVGNAKPLSLSGYWKGSLITGVEQVAATIYVSDTGFNPIAYGSDYIYMTLANWTPFNCLLNYTSGDPVGSTTIIISLLTTSANSNAFIDDLTMSYVTSTNDLVHAHFPSAIMINHHDNSMLLVDLLSNASFGVEVYNIHGQKVYDHREAGFSGHHEINIPAQLFTPGMYVCRITGTEIKSSLKFVRD